MSLRLSDDVVLRQSAASAELISRTAEHAIPLDDEEAVVVALLVDGASTTAQLAALARQHGIGWNDPTVEAFVERLVGWGLVERNGVNRTPRHDVDLDDADTNQAYADADTDQSLDGGTDHAYPEDDITNQSAPDNDITHQLDVDPKDTQQLPDQGGRPFDNDADITEVTDHPLLQVVDTDTEVVSPDAIEAAIAVEEQLKKTEEVPVPRARTEPPMLPQIQPQPRIRPRTDDEATVERRPSAKSLNALRVDRGVEPVPMAPLPTGPHRPSSGPMAAPQKARVAARPASGRLPHAVSLLKAPPAPPAPSKVPAAPASTSDTEAECPYPRLLPNWLPKLLPNSKHILFVDPVRGEQRKLQSWEYQVARRLDGYRSPEEVAEWAVSIGLRLRLEDVHGIIERLARDGIVEKQPSPAGRLPRRTPASVVRQHMEAAAGWQSVQAEPDSIMEGLAGLSKPGARPPSAGQPGAADDDTDTSERLLPAAGSSKALVGPQTIDDALTRAAALVDEQKHDEAKNVLRTVVDLNPGVVQAVAMLKLLDGTQETPHLTFWRRHLRLIVLGAVAVLVALLLAGLLIKIDEKVTLPCQTALLGFEKINSRVNGQVRAVLASEGAVVKKGQKLATLSDGGKRAELRRQIADMKDLLRIMKTKGGTIADEHRQRQLLARLQPELRELRRGCDNAGCKARIESIKNQITTAKKKQKFFKYLAEKRDILEVQAGINKLAKKAQQLSDVSLDIVSPAAGRLVSLSLARGKHLSVGQTVATICDAERLQVIARYGGKPMGDATVSLLHKSSRHTYRATSATRRGDELLFEIDGGGGTSGGSCHVEFVSGRISLISSWFRN